MAYAPTHVVDNKIDKLIDLIGLKAKTRHSKNKNTKTNEKILHK